MTHNLSGTFAPIAATTLTISSGSVTATQTKHIIAAESGVTDNLDTIVFPTDIASGYTAILILQADTGDTITVRDGQGNITTGNNADIILEGDARLVLEYDNADSDWKPINAVAQVSAFTVTNWTEDFALDCDADADAAICDTLGTLIKELIACGIIAGTVSA